MSYQPATDFVSLWRNATGGALKAEMPGLDFMVATLQRSGILNVHTGGTQPMSNQATTAWFRPASPSYFSEGMLFFWDAASSTYMPATPKLFLAYLQAS
jgi:hypothetical protein